MLAAEYPQLVGGYERLFTAKYAPPAYTGEVGRMVGLLKAKYGVATRARTPLDPETPAPAPADANAQASFRWPRLARSDG